MSTNKAPRGTRDILPSELGLWEKVEGTARTLFGLRGFQEIRPPLFEETSLFTRSIGEVTDIVEKEMFTVTREDSSYTFRPEGTAGVVRAYLEANFHKTKPFQRFFYIGPMFRYERPQKGRERQFNQIGIEALGSLDPFLDAESIHLALCFFEALGISGLDLRINSMGETEDRDRYRETLRGFLAPQIAHYCGQCKTRYERNLFRVLDCKVPADIERNQKAPSILDSLGPETAKHFEQVQSALKSLGRAFRVDPGTVRGLDYYTRTVFEVHDSSLGARSALCGGGRYDHLMQQLGGPDLGAVGFAIGMTGTLIALESRKLQQELAPARTQVYLALKEDGDRLVAFQLAESLRAQGISAEYVHEDGKSLKSQMRTADALGSPLVCMLSSNLLTLKQMQTGEQIDLPLNESSRIINEIKNRLA